jgi:hypothetical protein
MKDLHDVVPHSHHHFETLEDLRTYRRETVIKRTVDKTFSALAVSCPDLTVVVLKVDGRTVDKPEDDGTHPFLRSKQTDLHGQTTYVGVPVEQHMIKHYEPCSEILEPDNFGFPMLR